MTGTPVSARRRATQRIGSGMMILAVLVAACAPARVPGGTLATPGVLEQPPVAPVVAAGPGIAAVRGPIPFPFEANVGQAHPSIAYLLRAGDLHIGFRERGVSLRVHAAEPQADDIGYPGLHPHQP